MSCIHCQNTIEKALNEAVGVKKAKVSYSMGTADIEFDDEKTNIKSKLANDVSSFADASSICTELMWNRYGQDSN